MLAPNGTHSEDGFGSSSLDFDLQNVSDFLVINDSSSQAPPTITQVFAAIQACIAVIGLVGNFLVIYSAKYEFSG